MASSFNKAPRTRYCAIPPRARRFITKKEASCGFEQCHAGSPLRPRGVQASPLCILPRLPLQQCAAQTSYVMHCIHERMGIARCPHGCCCSRCSRSTRCRSVGRLRKDMRASRTRHQDGRHTRWVLNSLTRAGSSRAGRGPTSCERSVQPHRTLSARQHEEPALPGKFPHLLHLLLMQRRANHDG